MEINSVVQVILILDSNLEFRAKMKAHFPSGVEVVESTTSLEARKILTVKKVDILISSFQFLENDKFDLVYSCHRVLLPSRILVVTNGQRSVERRSKYIPTFIGSESFQRYLEAEFPALKSSLVGQGFRERSLANFQSITLLFEIGILTTKIDPFIGSLSSVIDPPFAFTISLEVNSPSPL